MCVKIDKAPVNSWGNYDSYQSSEIPRRIITDLHERSNEVLTVPSICSAIHQNSERSVGCPAGKEDPVELHFGLSLHNFVWGAD